jgi:2-hydroxychromene-2-carboxylate isomerase
MGTQGEQKNHFRRTSERDQRGGIQMRKVMLLAAVMAMILAAAAPAFAQATAVGGSVQYVDCDQIQAAATGQYNVANNQDLAAIAQELGVDENQVLACFESIAAGRDVNMNTASASAAATATAAAGSAQYDDGSASAAAGGELPDTGGTSLFALGVGVLLVAGDLLARRIFR